MKPLALALSAALLLLGAALAPACEIVPWPHRHGLQPVHLATQRVEVRVRDQAAEVTFDATFHNPNAAAVEGFYYMNVPAGAQVDRFSMTVNGKEVQAELLDAARAREIYHQIVHARRDPALLELVGQRMIKASVSPIAPGSDLRVRVGWTQVLPKDGSFVRLQVPFARSLAHDRPLTDAALAVTIESTRPLKAVYSPTHAVDIARKDDHRARAGFEQKNYSSRKDFLLYYSVSEDEVGLDLLTYREAGQDGYFILLASPRVEVDESRVLPKDVVFVFDRSGSMSGEKIRQARQALLFCLERLNPRDRFNIVDFATEVASFDRGLVPASAENRTRAAKYVEAIRAAGSTNIDGAIQAGLSMLEKDEARVPMLLFATDGLPTVGEQRPDQLVRNAVDWNKAGGRVFVFGVGTDVNTLFLDRLAEEGRGARDYVAPDEHIEAKVSALMEKVSHPVLGGLKLEFAGVKRIDVYPRGLPDLFKGAQLVCFGRYSGAGPATVELRGRAAGEEKVFRQQIAFPEADTRNDFIPRLWAGRKIAYLLDAIRLSGQAPKEIVEEIAALSRRFGIVTPYTSYLITEENQGRLGQKLEEKAKEGFARAAASGAPGAPAESKKAQDESAELRRAKDGDALESLDEGAARARREAGGRAVVAIKTVAARTFYLRGGVWVDGAFDEKDRDKVVKVVFLSDEYMKLVDAGLQQVLSVGEKVLLVHGGKIYQIE